MKGLIKQVGKPVGLLWVPQHWLTDFDDWSFLVIVIPPSSNLSPPTLLQWHCFHHGYIKPLIIHATLHYTHCLSTKVGSTTNSAADFKVRAKTPAGPLGIHQPTIVWWLPFSKSNWISFLLPTEAATPHNWWGSHISSDITPPWGLPAQCCNTSYWPGMPPISSKGVINN